MRILVWNLAYLYFDSGGKVEGCPVDNRKEYHYNEHSKYSDISTPSHI